MALVFEPVVELFRDGGYPYSYLFGYRMKWQCYPQEDTNKHWLSVLVPWARQLQA